VKKFHSKLIWPSSPVWEVSTDINISPQELNNLPWGSNRNNLEVDNKRQVVDLKYLSENYKTTSIHSIERLTSKESVISKLQELFDQDNEMFYNLYPFDRNRYTTFSSYLEKQLYVASYLVKDGAEYELTNHVDNRFTFGNIIINLVKNENTTAFYEGINTKTPWYTSSQDQGKGVLFINSERTVHNIKVSQTEPRYILMVKLLLTNLN